MATINIGGDPHDRDYQYKMPVPHCIREGSSKVIVDNILEIATALNRDPEWIAQYLIFKLDCQVKSSHNRLVIKSNISQIELIAELKTFIETYVVCPTCRLPELEMKKKKEIVYSKCDACGSRHKISKTSEKMYKFILHHLNSE